MDRKRLKVSDEALTVSRQLPRRSARLASRSQTPLQALTVSRQLPRRSERLASPQQAALQITDSKNPICNINLLPNEILVKIIGYLSQNDLGRIARVCRRLNECARVPDLWKKVDVQLLWKYNSQYEVFSNFAKMICSPVTHMKIDFVYFDWDPHKWMSLQIFCWRLKKNCLHLYTLSLLSALFSESLISVVNLCIECLPNLKVLILCGSAFDDNYGEEMVGFSKLEVLDISECSNIEECCIHLFSKMPYLRKLNLCETEVIDDYFELVNNKSFLHWLEWLNLRFTHVSQNIFFTLEKHAINLSELFLCMNHFHDYYYTFTTSVFPKLKTVCLFGSDLPNCDLIVSLVEYCPSLQNVYVEKDMAQMYAEHPFVIENISKLGIVKAVDFCDHCQKLQ